MITTVPADFITVDEVKLHLNKTNTDDDVELAGFISAAQQMVIARVGQVSAVTAIEEFDGGLDEIALTHQPVISVTSVQELPGLELIPEGDEGAGTDGWVLSNLLGVLRHTVVFPNRFRVTYQAGRDPVPGNIRLAALELAAHLWQSQRGSSNARPSFGDAGGEYPLTAGLPAAYYSLPIRVRELLGEPMTGFA